MNRFPANTKGACIQRPGEVIDRRQLCLAMRGVIADSENIAQAECPEGLAEVLSHLCRLDHLMLSEMTCGLSYQIDLTVGHDTPGRPRKGLLALRLSLTDVVYQVLGRPHAAAEPMPHGQRGGIGFSSPSR